MANTKISAFPSGSPAQSTDEYVIARAGANYKLAGSDIKTLVIGAGSMSVTSTKTLTVNNTLTLAGTDGTTMTFPSTSATIARTDAGNTFAGNQVVSSGSFGLSGNISAAAWTTNGIRYANSAATLTDTTSSGTVAAAYTDLFGGNTIAASNATTFTDYYTTWFNAATAGTNVTMTNKWALGLGGNLKLGPDASGTNQAGTNVIIGGSRGTGTGAGGSIIFQVAPAGTTGTAQNALVNALTINSNGSVLITIPGTNGSTLLTGGSFGLNFRNATNTAAQEIQCQRVTIDGTGYYWFVNRGLITSSADGVVHVQNSAINDATAQQLAFGLSTSSTNGCRIKRAAGGTSLQVRNGNDSGDADLTAKALTLSGNLTISTKDIVTDTTTGTKIGTATTQKIGFYNATPVVQPTAVADATDAATVITQLNALLAHMRTLGLIAT